MSDKTQHAGPEPDSGPAGEQPVTKDKGKSAADDAGQSSVAPGAAAEGQAAGQPAKDAAGDGTATEAGAAQATADTAAKAAPTGFAAEIEGLRSELDERLRDLQRVTAEYANYRKRVERDRGLISEQAVAQVVSALLPVLDDLDRARDHGDLVGPLAAMAEQLNTALTKFGLSGFGEAGDAFDPTRHEAVAHQTSVDVTAPTCVGVMRRGYLLGERLLRPALVAVADPE